MAQVSRRTFLAVSLVGSTGANGLLSQERPQEKKDKQGTIQMVGAINNAITSRVIEIIETYIKQGKTEITLNITSEGGEVQGAVSLYQYLKGRPIELTTHNFGAVDSAAVIIFAAGLRRLSTPLGRFLIHEPFYRLDRPVDENEVALNEKVARIRQETNAIAEILSEATGKAQSIAKSWLKDHVVWTAQQAKDNGLIHEIKSQLQVAASASTVTGPMVGATTSNQ